jgi:hypothetical protein
LFLPAINPFAAQSKTRARLTKSKHVGSPAVGRKVSPHFLDDISIYASGAKRYFSQQPCGDCVNTDIELLVIRAAAAHFNQSKIAALQLTERSEQHVGTAHRSPGCSLITCFVGSSTPAGNTVLQKQLAAAQPPTGNTLAALIVNWTAEKESAGFEWLEATVTEFQMYNLFSENLALTW